MPQYDEGLVKSRLLTLLRWRKKGLFLASQVTALAELADVEEGLKAAAAFGVLVDLEVSVLVARLVQGLGRRTVALATGLSEATIKRATTSGVRKLTNWLNGVIADESEPDEPEHMTLLASEETKI